MKESFQTIYKYKIIPKNSLQTTNREIIANNTYKLLSENYFKSYIYGNDIYVNTTRFQALHLLFYRYIHFDLFMI